MSAFFVAQVTIKNAELFQQYAEQAGKTFEEFGGEVVSRGKAMAILTDENQILDHQALALVRFPDSNKLNAWYQSAAYQKLIPLRNEAAKMVITRYQA